MQLTLLPRQATAKTQASFAIIEVPEGSHLPAGAIAHGPLDVITERVIGSKARAEAEALIARADQAAEEEREREQREAGDHHRRRPRAA